MTSTATHLSTDPGLALPGGAAADGKTGQDRLVNGPDGFARSADRPGPALDTSADRSATVSGRARPLRSWPLLVLAAPAAVAVWSGWVGIGQMTGFGEIRPLPGIWDSLRIDTAVTLPIGVEAYAAFALRAWLTSKPAVSDRTRGFARSSAIAALVLGMAGQVAYHLLNQAGVSRAPWEVTTAVSCLPVLVLGMGSALAHLLRSDASTAGAADDNTEQVRGATPLDPSLARGTRELRDQDVDPWRRHPLREPARLRLAEAHTAAERLIGSGQRVSRRSLRSAGLRGSNAGSWPASTHDPFRPGRGPVCPYISGRSPGDGTRLRARAGPEPFTLAFVSGVRETCHRTQQEQPSERSHRLPSRDNGQVIVPALRGV